ncbi:hypothetical protein [Angustibacter sp. Root456]|uniref:hypothetical protein n=1 Tax=Angustibacter sp. Root456 TaxID=1736539 RepID=UPI0012FC66A8|nr:hypothetical protein [Angustibacter sp. Root456]
MRKPVLAAAALSVPLALATAAPALAAPSYDPNPAGNGITQMELTCDGQTVTILTNSNRSSENGGWSVGRIVGDGHLVPTSFTFGLVDLATGDTIWSGQQLKGGGHANPQGQVVTCSQVEPTGMSLADVLAAPDTPPGIVLTPGTENDPAGFEFSVTAISRP